jgi:tetratricopeptide (TPR) repeat protein
MDVGNNERAMRDFDQAILLKSDYALGYLNRGVALRNLKRPNEALVALATAIERDPKLILAYEKRAFLMKIVPTGAPCTTTRSSNWFRK